MSTAESSPWTGPLERAGFSPGLTLPLALIVGFLAFQGISLLVAIPLLMVSGGFDASLAADLPAMVERYAGEFLIANTVGQFLGLLGLGWLLTRLHTRQVGWFLRLRLPDARALLLSVAGLVVLVPLVQWLGGIMDALPWPESIRAFEQAQIELIERVLANDFSVWFALLTMAVTPALCEEVFFRGYLQRQAERAFTGWVLPVILIGVIFGLYHLRLTQAVPLSLLGIYFAYITWRTGSLWPAVVGHFLNNGFAVMLGAYVHAQPDLSLQDVESLQIPAYILVPSALLFVAVAWTLHRTGAEGNANQGGAE